MAGFTSILVSFLFAKRFSNLKNKVFTSIVVTFALLVGIQIIRLTLTNFSNPNAAKWAVLGLFFVPIYTAPTVFTICVFMSKYFDNRR